MIFFGQVPAGVIFFKSIQKIEIVDAEPSEDKAIIALALFFVSLYMYVVNGK